MPATCGIAGSRYRGHGPLLPGETYSSASCVIVIPGKRSATRNPVIFLDAGSRSGMTVKESCSKQKRQVCLQL